MNLGQAKALFNEIFRRRNVERRPQPQRQAIQAAIARMNAATAADAAWRQDSQTALTLSQDAIEKGTCTYTIDGGTFETRDTTRAECESLPDSTFTPN